MPSRAWVVTAGTDTHSSSPYVSMPSRAWVVTKKALEECGLTAVSMPSRAWVVTQSFLFVYMTFLVSMPSRAWVVTKTQLIRTAGNTSFNALTGLSCYGYSESKDGYPVEFQCPHGLELLLVPPDISISIRCFNALTGLSCYSCPIQFWLVRF